MVPFSLFSIFLFVLYYFEFWSSERVFALHEWKRSKWKIKLKKFKRIFSVRGGASWVLVQSSCFVEVWNHSCWLKVPVTSNRWSFQSNRNLSGIEENIVSMRFPIVFYANWKEVRAYTNTYCIGMVRNCKREKYWSKWVIGGKDAFTTRKSRRNCEWKVES